MKIDIRDYKEEMITKIQFADGKGNSLYGTNIELDEASINWTIVNDSGNNLCHLATREIPNLIRALEKALELEEERGI